MANAIQRPRRHGTSACRQNEIEVVGVSRLEVNRQRRVDIVSFGNDLLPLFGQLPGDVVNRRGSAERFPSVVSAGFLGRVNRLGNSSPRDGAGSFDRCRSRPQIEMSRARQRRTKRDQDEFDRARGRAVEVEVAVAGG